MGKASRLSMAAVRTDYKLRIATLNVFFLASPEHIADALQPHLPLDVLALQEVRSQAKLEVFARALRMRVAVVCEADACVGLSNALLVRADETESACRSITLDYKVENRAAVMLELPRASSTRIICTHLDHRREDVRSRQFHQLQEAFIPDSSSSVSSSTTPVFLLGDFNALRRADYDDATWQALVRKRAEVNIDSETTLTDEIERTLVDCRGAAEERRGNMRTSIHQCRIDYVWASSAALSMWRVREYEHAWLHAKDGTNLDAVAATTEEEGDLLTDHALVVCSLERMERNA